MRRTRKIQPAVIQGPPHDRRPCPEPPHLPDHCDRYELDQRGAMLGGVEFRSTVLHSDDPATALVDWLTAHPD